MSSACSPRCSTKKRLRLSLPRPYALCSYLGGLFVFVMAVCSLLGHGLGKFPMLIDIARRRAFAGANIRTASVSTTERSSPFGKPKRFLYAYEKNKKTGSTSWMIMMRTAGSKTHDLFPCKNGNAFDDALEVVSNELSDRDALITCHMRRMSIPRRPHIRFISSFNLEKDMVLSLFMERFNLTIDKVDRSGSDYQTHKEEFKATWSLEYMGYTDSRFEEFSRETKCPMSNAVKQLVEVAVEDTYLPISHDLPCISRKLLRQMVGLMDMEELKLNVRNGREEVEWETDLSCVDEALTKAMTVKLVKLFDGSDLSAHEDWRAGARSAEEGCAANV